MSRLLLGRTTLALGALLVTACGSSAGEEQAGRAETSEQRAVATYAAALERFLAEAPRAVGAPADMYVVQRTYEQAGINHLLSDPPGELIPTAVQTGLAEALAGTAELTWVADDNEVLREGTSEAGIPCAWIRDGDLVVTLDRLVDDASRDEVSVAAVGHEFSPDSCAVFWLNTYVVEATEDGWQVTGRTTPSGMS